MSDQIEAVKILIIEALMLEDISPEDIDTDAPLFGDGLGLDSIDALELAMEIKERFGVQLDSASEQNRAIFASVRNLADHISGELASGKAE